MKSSAPSALRAGFVTAVLAVLAVGSGHANLLENPSFELGPDPGEAMQLAVGSTAIPGWVVTRNPIDYCGTRWENYQNGTRSIGLNGANPGGVAQTIATVSGELYLVSFYLSGDSFSDPSLKNLRVTAAGQSQNYTFETAHSWPWSMGWAENTFSFTANSNSTTLEFYSLDAGATGPALDNVVAQSSTSTLPPSWGNLALESPYPNPAPRGCSIAFTIPAALAVRVSIFDMQGREISELAHRTFEPGRHVLPWGGEIEGGRARAGIYFVRLSCPLGTIVRRAVLAP